MRIRLACLFSLALAGCVGVADAPTGSSRGAAISCPTSPAAKLMKHAICLCDNFTAVGNGLTTTSSSGAAANVGINGTAQVVGHYDIAGSLLAYKGIEGVGELKVRDDVVTFGGVQGVGRVMVGRDLALKGNLQKVGYLEVGGKLKVGGTTELVGQSGTLAPAAFDLADSQPCGCDAAAKLDVTQKIANAKANPANKTLSAIDSVGDQKTVLTTGSYYLKGGIHTVGSSRITIEGAVALFVDGDIETVGDGLFEVKPGSTLDLYISGKLDSVGQSVFSSGDPGAVRLYLGGTMPRLQAVGMQNMAVSIYAPDADLELVGDAKIRGSIFAKSISGVGSFHVDYAAPVAPAPGTCGTEGSGVPAGGKDGAPAGGGADGIN